jgi:serine/threonine protein kinase
MEYCEGGTAYDSIKRMKYSGGKNDSSHRFDLSSLVIAFGQICNAVSYLHAQHPPIVHRDLKPVNFLLKNGAYKVCDFGSAVIGHTDLRTPELRRLAEEVVNKTTTQMFRAPEMVDLYMTKRLTEATDVWALGCCLYSLAYLCDCFEEGSNLAILSCKYKIPANNPYGDGLVDLLDRMLTLNYKDRATMSEVIMCLSALYSNRPLPKRTRIDNNNEKTKKTAAITAAAATTRVQTKNNDDSNDNDDSSSSRATKGTYKTDGQGIRSPTTTAIKKSPNRNIVTVKKLDPNSAAAKRKKAAALMTTNTTSATIHTGFFPVTTPLPLPQQQQQQPSLQSSASHTATTTSTFDTTFDDNFGFDSSNFHDTTSTSQEEGIEVTTTTTPSPTKNGGVDDDNVSFSTSFEHKCQILDSATITATAAATTTTSPLSSAFDTSNSFTWPTTENEI